MKARHDEGFTLAEMLMALAVISLSLAGIWQSARLVSHMNHTIENDRKSEMRFQAFSAELTAKLTPLQPITDHLFVGGPRQIRFACEPDALTASCSVDAPSGTFAYVSSGQVFPEWPQPASIVQTDGIKPRLEAILLQSPQYQNLLVLTLPVENPADCQFDMISRTCREKVALDE